jgi:hypothetical protein
MAGSPLFILRPFVVVRNIFTSDPGRTGGAGTSIPYAAAGSRQHVAERRFEDARITTASATVASTAKSGFK